MDVEWLIFLGLKGSIDPPPISHIIVLHVASRLDLGLLLLPHEGAKKCIDAE